MKVYIKKNKSNHFANLNFAVALDGFEKMGWEIIPFNSLDELSNLTKEDVFVGYVDETKQIFEQLGIKYRNVDCYPQELNSFLGRKIWKGSFFNFVKANNFGCFIKPATENKLFSGNLPS